MLRLVLPAGVNDLVVVIAIRFTTPSANVGSDFLRDFYVLYWLSNGHSASVLS